VDARRWVTEWSSGVAGIASLCRVWLTSTFRFQTARSAPADGATGADLALDIGRASPSGPCHDHRRASERDWRTLPDGATVRLSQPTAIGLHTIAFRTAHVLAQPCLDLWPARPTRSASIDHGFYYDFLCPRRPRSAQRTLRIDSRCVEIIARDQRSSGTRSTLRGDGVVRRSSLQTRDH
jgi:hypothetical protein